MSRRPIAAKLRDHFVWRSRQAADLARRGDRQIVMTPERGMRFGNWLYLWLYAHDAQAHDSVVLVRQVEGMEPWLTAFPALQRLTIRNDEISFHDARGWNERMWNQHFGTDFSRVALGEFVTEVLAPRVRLIDDDVVVINVRRGDYYSTPELRRRYAFDQVGYVAAALKRLSTIERVRVVSDDPDWCIANLDTLLRATGARVTYDPQDPVENFLTIAGAKRLIGMNSTFTYWGAYAAGSLQSQGEIIFPSFHARGHDAHQLDPNWATVDGFDRFNGSPQGD